MIKVSEFLKVFVMKRELPFVITDSLRRDLLDGANDVLRSSYEEEFKKKTRKAIAFLRNYIKQRSYLMTKSKFENLIIEMDRSGY